jgi:hypothetical protein
MENEQNPAPQQEQNVNPWSVTGEIGGDGKVKPIVTPVGSA